MGAVMSWRWVWLGWMATASVGCAAHAPVARTPHAVPVADEPATPADEAETYKYCAGTVTEWEEHKCIWELTPEQQRRRSYSQRLVYRSGRLERFETVTGSGAIYKSDTSTTNTYRYEGGRIVEYSSSNRNDVLKGGAVFSDGMRLILWKDEQGRPKPKEDSKVSGLRRTLSAQGRVLSYEYVDHAGKPTPSEGVSRVDVKRSPQGAVLEESFFGDDGEPIRNSEGVHRVEYVVDQHGVALEARYFDEQGQPTPSDGVYVERTQYDDVGNTRDVAFYDTQNNLVMSLTEGAARLHYTRDARGNETKLELFDAAGRPIVGAYHYASRTRRFDEHDLTVEWAYFGADGAPLRTSDVGDAIMRQTRDARGNVIRERFYDENAAPTLGVDGYHEVDIAYDARDNPISYRYLDVASAPVMVTQGYQWRKLTYDGDRLIRTEYFDAKDRPVNAFGKYGITEIAYAPDGSEAERRNIDASASPLLSCNGQVSPELQTEISEQAALTRFCYQRLLRTSPKATGKLMVELRLDAKGQVARASLVTDELAEPELSSCVLGLMRSRSFDNAPVGGCTVVRVPLSFRPKPLDP
jgi:YD repeat-containing protein